MIRKMLILAVCSMALSTAHAARPYRVETPTDQLQSAEQTVVRWRSGDAFVVRAQDGNFFFQAEPRLDFFKTPYLAFYYRVGMESPGAGDRLYFRAEDLKLYVDGRLLRRFTQAEQMAWVDKERRSTEFWGAISAASSSLNAYRTSGRSSFRGTSSGVVRDSAGNQFQVRQDYVGVVKDHDAANRAADAAAIDQARRTYDRMGLIDAAAREVLNGSPEEILGDRSGITPLSIYAAYELPRARRGVRTPMVLEATIVR